MKLFSVLITLIFSASSFAGELTYVPDFSQMKDMDATSLDICGYPTEFEFDSSDPIGPTFISKLFSWGTITTERIQATDGSISGGGLAPEFSGDYREKVYIVKQVIPGVYDPGVYNRVQVNTYGSTAAPSGMVVNTELINHRYSAELAEGAFCGDVYYKLQ